VLPPALRVGYFAADFTDELDLAVLDALRGLRVALVSLELPDLRKARFLSAVDHIQLDRLRRRVMQEMDALFRRVDVLLAPEMVGAMTVIGNMTGHPCLTVRVGFRESRTRLLVLKSAVDLERCCSVHTGQFGLRFISSLMPSLVGRSWGTGENIVKHPGAGWVCLAEMTIDGMRILGAQSDPGRHPLECQ
jgi:hypothetical protein